MAFNIKRKRDLQEMNGNGPAWPDEDSTSSEDSEPGSAAHRLKQIMDPKGSRPKLFSNLLDNPIEKPRRSVVLRALQTPVTTSTPFNNRRINKEYFLNASPITTNQNEIENDENPNKRSEIIILQTSRENKTKQNLYGENNECNESVSNSLNKGNFSESRIRDLPAFCGEPVENLVEDNGDQSVHDENGIMEKSVEKIVNNDTENRTDVSKHASTSFKKLNTSSEVKTYGNTSKTHLNALLHNSSEDSIDENLMDVSLPSENEYDAEIAKNSSQKSQKSKTLCDRLQRLEEEIKVIKSGQNMREMKACSDENRRSTQNKRKSKTPGLRKTLINTVTRVNGKFQNKTWTCERSTSPRCPSSDNFHVAERVPLENVLEEFSTEDSQNFEEIPKKRKNLQRCIDRLSKRHNELLNSTNEQVVKESRQVQTSIHCLNNNSNKIPDKSCDSILFKTIPNDSRMRDKYFESEDQLDVSPHTSNNKPWRFSIQPSSSQGMSSINLNFLRKSNELKIERNIAKASNRKSYFKGQPTSVSASSIKSTASSIPDSSTTKDTSTGLKFAGYELESNYDEVGESSKSLASKEIDSNPILNRNLKELFVSIARLPIKSLHPQPSLAKRTSRDTSSLKKDIFRERQHSDSTESERAEKIVFTVPKESVRKIKRKTSVRSIKQCNVHSPLEKDMPVPEQDPHDVHKSTGLNDKPEEERKAPIVMKEPDKKTEDTSVKQTKRKTRTSERSRKQSTRKSSLTEENHEGLKWSLRTRKRQVSAPKAKPYEGIWQLTDQRWAKRYKSDNVTKCKQVVTANTDTDEDSAATKSTRNTVLKKQKSLTKKSIVHKKHLKSISDESQKQLNFCDEDQPGPSNIAGTCNNSQFSIIQQNIKSILNGNGSNIDSGSSTMHEETNVEVVKGRKATRSCTSAAKNVARLDGTVDGSTDLKLPNNCRLIDFTFAKGIQDTNGEMILQKFEKLQDNLQIGRVIVRPNTRTGLLKENMEVIYYIIEGSAVFHVSGNNTHVYANNAYMVPAGVRYYIENSSSAKLLEFFEAKLGPKIDMGK